MSQWFIHPSYSTNDLPSFWVKGNIVKSSKMAGGSIIMKTDWGTFLFETQGVVMLGKSQDKVFNHMNATL